ncbi:MAG: glycerophosphodiester phosphodiesterase [Clostridia bacterium]|nr:glycerophosphodiester phosphodiesterase [Clostridia bacterium]MBQ8368415.1 glycerophosphodiester phosphodiesterase [Clostridia bacterium]
MKPITESLTNREKSYPIITAHSGCEGTPDNSIEHIKAAIASGAECFEIDVHEHNGTLYLTHDEKGNYEGCPTLADCYALVAADDRVIMQCDCKSFGLARKCADLAAEYGIQNRVLVAGSVGFDEIPALDETETDWWLGMWHSDREAEELTENCAKLREMGDKYRIVNVDAGMVNDFMIAKIREYGYHLSVWTVNNEADLRRFLALDVIWNITTRTPKRALELRREICGV